MLDKPDFYMTMLRMFVDAQRTYPAQMEACLERHDQDGAQRMAHTLKGLAGNIGATHLQEAASVLESELSHKAPLGQPSGAWQTVSAVLSDLLKALDDALPAVNSAPTRLPTTPNAPAPQDKVQYQSACEQLAHLLKEDDPQAMQCLLDNAWLLEPVFGPEFLSVQKCIRDFDFEEALNILAALMDNQT